MVTLIEAIILSIIQGVTEWFPVSSSGHLALIQNLFGVSNLSYAVFLHFASIFAVLFVFNEEVLSLLKLDRKSLRYVSLLVVGLIPAAFVGFYFGDFIEGLFSNIRFLGFFFILSGILIYSTKFTSERKNNISGWDAFFIGLLQSVSILPGVSRSGMTISAGLFRRVSKRAAISFSFLMSIPLIMGASVLKAKDLVVSEIDMGILAVSFFVTLFVSIITIKLLVRIIRSDNFYLFGIYNVVLGIVVLILG